MKLVVIESPYANNIERNVLYLKRVVIDCLARGEAPFASHLLYTQVLNDNIPAERALGMEAGFAWSKKAELTVVYGDYGISEGMELGIAEADAVGRRVEYRKIGKNPQVGNE